MKFLVNDIEKKYILEIHSKMKKSFVNEQYDVRAELQKLIDTGCIRDGEVIKMESTDVLRTYAIKKKSVNETDTYYYFFIDKSVAKRVGTSGDAEFLPDTQWKCS